jgi:hypothetical protein
MKRLRTRLTVAITSSLLFNALILWGIVQSNMDGFTAMLLAVLFNFVLSYRIGQNALTVGQKRKCWRRYRGLWQNTVCRRR